MPKGALIFYILAISSIHVAIVHYFYGCTIFTSYHPVNTPNEHCTPSACRRPQYRPRPRQLSRRGQLHPANTANRSADHYREHAKSESDGEGARERWGVGTLHTRRGRGGHCTAVAPGVSDTADDHPATGPGVVPDAPRARGCW